MSNTNVSLKLNLASRKKGGMAVPAVWRLKLCPSSSNPNSAPKLTGGTPVLLSQNPKASCFWYKLPQKIIR